MDLGLKGKVAIITGSTEGIGKATALKFAKEGAKVAICSRSQEKVDATVAEIKKARAKFIGPPRPAQSPRAGFSQRDAATQRRACTKRAPNRNFRFDSRHIPRTVRASRKFRALAPCCYTSSFSGGGTQG